MAVAAPALAILTRRGAPSFDSTWLIWLPIIAVLVFLVVSPFVSLVVTSFTAEKTGELWRTSSQIAR